MQPNKDRLALPLHLLALQMVGMVLVALGASDLIGVSLIPASVLFHDYGITLIIVGIALAGPGAFLTVKKAKERAHARSGASVDEAGVIEPETRNLSQPPLTLAPGDRPWLKNKQWAAREIHYPEARRPLGLLYLALAYIFFGGIPGIFVWAESNSSQPKWGEILFVGGASIAFLGLVTGIWLHSWLPWRRYGHSICRLITLPGVVGGWFKADLECRPPADPTEPVVVRLKNVIGGGRGQQELWRMEQKLTFLRSPDSKARSIVPVRLQIPRRPQQLPIPIDVRWFQNRPQWLLEIEKKAPGVDFFASFRVPIYDTGYGDPAEQRPD